MKRSALALVALLGLFSAALAQSWTTPGPSSGTGYPAGATPFTTAALGTTNAVVTITAQTGKTTYICGLWAIEGGGNAESAAGTVTNLLGLTGAAVTFSFLYTGTFQGTSDNGFTANFTPCIPAVAGQNVVVTSPNATGATATAINVTGYFF